MANDWTGKKVGYLTILRRYGTAKRGFMLWEAQCECGKKLRISSELLAKPTAHPRTCGCHGWGFKSTNTLPEPSFIMVPHFNLHHLPH